jgi:histone-lysine N-methyltransferase SETMAR
MEASWRSTVRNFEILKNSFFQIIVIMIHKRPSRPHGELRDWKVMMILALQGNRVLTYEILAKGETVDGERFKRFLVRNLRPALIRALISHPIILMDNARPHYHQVVRDYLERRGWEILHHSPYSPDMNPCDFDGIERIKKTLKGRHFHDEAGLVAAYSARIDDLNESGNFSGINQLPEQWHSIIENCGDYVVN